MRKHSLQLEIEFQLCRGLYKHQWEPCTLPQDDGRRTQWGYRVAKLCTRCGTTAVTSINALGQKEPWSYKYPDGYSLPADEVPTQEQLNLSILAENGINEYFGDKPIKRGVKKRKPAATKKAPAKKAVARRAPAKKATPRGRHLRAVS